MRTPMNGELTRSGWSNQFLNYYQKGETYIYPTYTHIDQSGDDANNEGQESTEANLDETNETH